MNVNITLSDFLSLLAIILSGFSAIKSYSASKLSNDLAKGQSEIDIRNMILTAQYHYSEMSIALIKDAKNKVLQQQVLTAIEMVANAYDEACAKYIDGKIDKERFKKLYFVELRKWVEDENLKDKYVMPHTKFKATVRVYNEWYDLEK